MNSFYIEETTSIFSAMTIIIIMMMILIMIISIVIPIVIGVFVYKDAKCHHMNAAMWTLIAILAPSFIGLIIYLIMRSDQPDSHCIHCHSPVKKDYVRCPKCGAPLKKQCTACGHLLEDNWNTCPGCGASITKMKPISNNVVIEPEKGIGKIMIPIIIVLVIIAILLAILLIGIL